MAATATRPPHMRMGCCQQHGCGTTINSVSVADEEIKVVTSAMRPNTATPPRAPSSWEEGRHQPAPRRGGELFRITPCSTAGSSSCRPIPNRVFKTCSRCPISCSADRSLSPHLQRQERTFFEIGGSYHVDSSSNASTYATPTSDMLAGNFSAFTNQLYDPASTSGTFAAGNLARTPFPGNIIPTSRFSTMWNAIAANKPSPRLSVVPGASQIRAPRNIVASGSGTTTISPNQVRIDHSFSDKFKVDGQRLRGQPASAREQRQHSLRAVRSVPGVDVYRPERRCPQLCLHPHTPPDQRDQTR